MNFLLCNLLDLIYHYINLKMQIFLYLIFNIILTILLDGLKKYPGFDDSDDLELP